MQEARVSRTLDRRGGPDFRLRVACRRPTFRERGVVRTHDDPG